MYEVAHVAGNKVEAACALQSLSNIMGQITSSHHHGKSSNTKIYPRHSMSSTTSSAAATARKDEKLYRDHLKDMYKLRESFRSKDTSSNGQIRIPDRPVTISEMNAYNVEKSEAVNNGNSTKISKNNKEFYTVGEGYHKTDSCYYKTPDGGYHKLPPDSFHKMSEICYTKLPDGSFKRIDQLNNTVNGSGATAGDADSIGGHGSQHKVRNQMIRFLKRSKSHTPATIKEMQKAKDKERERMQAAVAAGGNRKVVVTMMENGGLPIVATSKAPKREQVVRDKSQHNHKEHRNNNTKVSFILVPSFTEIYF